MKVEQRILSRETGWRACASTAAGEMPQLGLAFGPRSMIEDPNVMLRVRDTYPRTPIVWASGAGVMAGAEVTDDQLVFTGLTLDHSSVQCISRIVPDRSESRRVGRDVVQELLAGDLVHILVLCDGLLVNGSRLVEGMNELLPPHVSVTGGLAGDGMDFFRSIVGANADIGMRRVVAVGFYGSRLKVGHGCCSGWSPYGDECVVTRAEDNLLFELDGKPALERYCEHLGVDATAQPLATMHFPVHMREEGELPVVRASHMIDQETGVVEFAGDMVTGSRVRFLQATAKDLIDGAVEAARATLAIGAPELVLCVNCIGRRAVLGADAARELAEVHGAFPGSAVFSGFYSYGEIAPGSAASGCQFHNQTMTLTSLREV
jgi:hypothetical protein